MILKVFWPNFAKRGGLVVVVVQDCRTGIILMVAFTNEAGFMETLRTGEAVYYSTSRNERWKKGETSGSLQYVRDILIDCDGDALVYRVEQVGMACHTLSHSCFFRSCIGARALNPVPRMGEAETLIVREMDVHRSFVPRQG